MSKCERLRTISAASDLVSLESIASDRYPGSDLETASSSLAPLPRLIEQQLGHRGLARLPRKIASLRNVASLTIVDGGRARRVALELEQLRASVGAHSP